jgi:wobble nucleotide-excising tRNase
MGVKVRQFRWKDDGQDSPKERGLIAQELEPFFPELVSTFEAEDKQATKSVNYTSLGIIALKGVQELKEEKDLEIDRLGKIIAEKQAKIDTLEERLDRLEQLLLNP